MPISLPTADKFAEKILTELAPFCEMGMCQIAGSIRRRRPFVNDIDVVCLPAEDKLNALRERCKRSAKRVVTDGEQTLVVILQNDLQVDVWLAKPARSDMFDAKPANFGSLLLCRTGSAAHNIYLIEHAKKLGLVWNPYHGVFAPVGHPSRMSPEVGQASSLTPHTRCIASASEEEIFKALGLDYIPPDRRERP